VSDLNDTDGITAKVVDSIGDDDMSATTPYQHTHPDEVAPTSQTPPCSDCKQIGVLRACIILLALVVAAFTLLYLAQRKGFGGHHHEEQNGIPVPAK
jgi:hypothetical protein